MIDNRVSQPSEVLHGRKKMLSYKTGQQVVAGSDVMCKSLLQNGCRLTVRISRVQSPDLSWHLSLCLSCS